MLRTMLDCDKLIHSGIMSQMFLLLLYSWTLGVV